MSDDRFFRDLLTDAQPARPAFRAELRDRLSHEWHDRTTISPASGAAPAATSGRRAWWTIGTAAAVLVLVVSGLAWVDRPDDPAAPPFDTSHATSVSTAPTATTPETTVVPHTTVVPDTTTSASTTPPISTAPSFHLDPVTAPVVPLWIDVPPGATAPLPPAPLSARNYSTLVWTGTELIVWRGAATAVAAFDPATGAWRTIATPPDGVHRVDTVAGFQPVVWSGEELFVWSDGREGSSSAAYNPATDSWRPISDPPTPSQAAFWTGDEALLVRSPESGEGGLVDPGTSSFAYDPATDQWRRLADGPWGTPVGWVGPPAATAVWTGTTLITLTETDDAVLLNAYDPVTDSWRELDALDGGLQPVVIAGRGGEATTVAFLPLERGAPVEVFDDRGNRIGQLAGRPAELASTCVEPSGNSGCLLTSLRSALVGGEVLFWYSNDGWAIDLETQTWRSLTLDGMQPGWDGTEIVAVGDLLFAWSAGRDGLVYRAATPG